MHESIHKYFKVGTLIWMSYPHRKVSEAAYQLAKDDFFDVVELSHMENPAERSAIRDMFVQSHMALGYGAHPTLLKHGLNPNALDECERQKAERVLLEAVDEASFLGAGSMAFLSGRWELGVRDEAYQQLLKTTRSVCSYAEERGVDVELEVFDYDVDKRSLIGPAPLAARFAADMRLTHRNFGLLIDLSHIPLTHEGPAFVVRALRPYLTHFHIGSAVLKEGCPAYGDKHPRFGFPNGVNDVEQLLRFLRILKREGFFSSENPYILSFEVSPQGMEDEDIVLAGCKRTLRRAWALLED